MLSSLACLLTAAGYLAYPVKVSSNILNSFGADDIAIQVSTCQASWPSRAPKMRHMHLLSKAGIQDSAIFAVLLNASRPLQKHCSTRWFGTFASSAYIQAA
jgi:hypothetical protein